MGMLWRGLLLTAAVIAIGPNVIAQPTARAPLELEKDGCAKCHGDADRWEADTLHLYVSVESVTDDIHWRSGLRCRDCHGGDPTTLDPGQAHAVENGFRKVESPADLASFCGHCHSNAQYMQLHAPDAPLDQAERFLSSVHGKQPTDDPDSQALTCSSCHPVHKMRAVDDPLSAVHAGRLNETCGACHREQASQLAVDVHGNAAGTKALDCSQCHRNDIHEMVSVQDRRSSVFLDNQVKACGECHATALQEYDSSVHGRGLHDSGLLVTAACADCHGAHGIYPASQEQSTLHKSRVSSTCASCHRFIEQRLAESVHGRGDGPGRTLAEAAPGGAAKRRPTCTDCHAGHDLALARSDRFRLGLSKQCGECHADQTGGYAISMHGALTELGYGPAANCSDCHGAHEILPVSDPASRLSPANRRETCAECHPRAWRNFVNFDPHADHRDPDRNLLLFCVYTTLITFLISTFGFFALHSLFWFLRSLIDVMKNGRPKPLVAGAAAYVRFGPGHRMAHTIMVISFLGLALTGLPLKYSHTQWAQTLAYGLGGFESTGVWHRLFGVVNIALLAGYVCRMLRRWLAGPRNGTSRMGVIFGPDSPVPTWRDLKDFVRMIRWFFGLGPKPTFERWTYWEKYDFWGASADIVVIGFTGLVLWFPHLFCGYLPGEALNIAKVIHSTQALLATGFVFAIHFFNTHLRPEKFPMDMSILTGLISEEEAHEERPEFIERMRRAGKLDELRTTVPEHPRLSYLMLGGSVALAIGLGLLVGIVLPFLAG